ncbi:MAG TPA: penicillin-binding protein 1C [Bacteroidales bacterium]|nr:penicillin-binding protein 1C [Bacteroidales bacterium]
MPRFKKPLSTVVMAADSSLLGARIADDGQWRFPDSDVPEKFEKALLTFEDQWFRYHPGVNPVSIIRAVKGNIRSGEIVSGGSTITMQVARIAGGNRERTYLNKLMEVLSALKLELFRSKKSILEMYAANAPFGGNTVGLEAAAWRYTGKSASSLSWAEAASLAILPNSPGLVFPGRNQEILRKKRDRLLKKLCEKGYFDTLTLSLAVEEPVPGEPGPLPVLAPHLTDHFFKTKKGQVTVTTIEPFLQEKAKDIINAHQKDLSANFIFNSACIIVEVKTGNVLAYVGNSASPGDHGGDVDIIKSRRSTGSILKPFLYAAMQQAGDILPNSLIPDIPTRFPGFSPKNFDLSYSGAVEAGTALSQSLNIPAVKMLQQYNPERFLEVLKKTGFTTFDKPASYYGLSIILGGGETSLWELSGAYASLSRVLDRYLEEKKYYSGDYHPPVLESTGKIKNPLTEDANPVFSASAIWLTYDALLKVNRPESETGWQYFSSAPVMAWKTGTSFGFRDAWAVGTTPKYVIAVWTGNADGEGRPGLTGITAAAPILFDLVNLTGSGDWFGTPYEDLTMISVCRESGFRAGPDCPETIEINAHINGLRTMACPYHQVIHLDPSGTHRVNTDCISPSEIRNESWFVLPPAMEYFYRQKHTGYRPLPPVDIRCMSDKSIPAMEFIYPTPGVKIFIPRDQTGLKTRIVAEIAHRNPSKKIFWHLDESYLATSRSIHQVEILASRGNHLLTAVDEDGNMIKTGFMIE